MNKIATFIKPILFFLAVINCAYAQEEDHLRYVDPFIGTTKSGVLTRWGGDGGTYPGAVAPSGFIQISPETHITGGRGYNYTDTSVYYFSCINHPSGFPDGSAGHLFIMPVMAGKQFEPGKYNSRFSHRDEVARPGYYKIVFKDNQTIAEAVASTRTGVLRFTFARGIKPQIFVGDAGTITMPTKRVLHGEIANTVINISEDYTEKKQVKNGYLLSFKSSAAGRKTIELKLSTSTINFAGAQNNIDKELKQLSFDQLVRRTRDEWAKQLSVIDVKDPDSQNKTIFYTALYHSLLIPWVISDVDDRYRGADNLMHQTNGKKEYGFFSPWDTFRSLHPLLSLLYPEKQNDIILSMLDFYRQTGHLPTESMTGNHAVPIIVDAYLKGITGFDKTLAYEAMKRNIVDSPFVQNDLTVYHRMGYVPFTSSESVTRTVEYAYDDWALSQYARQVANNDKDYQLLQQRGYNYRNLFNSSELFMLPRNGGDFKINPGMSGYKEGDKWVYSYFVPQNGKDLVNLMGGNETFANRLDSALTNNVILFDNETVIHLPYLFNVAGRPGLTQKWCRDIMLSRFKASPDGLPGNDDLGAMSSAYLFNAMGIFPVCPGRPLYAIGSPLFQSVKLHLANKKTFVIESKDQSAPNKYVRSLTVNGQPYEQLSIPHSLLMKGGIMQFVMSESTTEQWPKNKDPLEFSETKKAADLQILKYSLSKTKVEPDEQFWLRFSITNKGSLGTKKVIVFVNGKEYVFKNCLVPPGAILTDSISCRLYKLGQVTVGLDRMAAKMVEVAEPTHLVAHPFTISGLIIKPVIKINGEQQIQYNVKNLTGKEQLFTIPVLNNDSLLYKDSVKLQPGERKAMMHRFTVNKAGLKTIIADSARVKYKVYSNNPSTLLLDLSLTSSGNIVADKSGFENDGSVMRPKPGKDVKGSRILLGDSCFVEVPNSQSLDNMGENITMMAWVYPKGEETGLVDMLTKGDSHVLQMMNNKTLTFFAGGWGRGDCTVNLPANWKQQWHHIAGVCKGDILSVYIDGKLSGTSKVEGAVNLSIGNKWQIGRNEEFPSERIFHGYIDGVKVFEEALSADEIQAVFVKGEAGI
jgi:putative alpha-1,2-mannosidase